MTIFAFDEKTNYIFIVNKKGDYMSIDLDYGEFVIAKTKAHWKTYFYSFLWFIWGSSIYWGAVKMDLAAWKWVGTIFSLPFLYQFVANKSKEYIVTNYRVYYIKGILSKEEYVIPAVNINNVILDASFLQRILGTGDVIICTGNDSNLVLHDIKNPERFKAAISSIAP